MTIINREKLESLFTALNMAFKEGLSLAELKPSSISMVVPSSTKIEEYPVLMLLSTIREWIGPRQIQNIAGGKLQIVNKPFEHTIGIPRDDVKDGLIAMFPMLFKQMGVDAENLWAVLEIEALIANGKWIDDKAFFVADRKFENSTICNLTTDALSAASYAAARLMMMQYTNHAGKPMGIVPDTLLVGPALVATANEIINDDKVVQSYAADTDDETVLNHVAKSNPNYKTATVEMSPLLNGASANYWFLAKTKGVTKPVIIQKREIGALFAWDTEHDTCVKDFNRNDYGIFRRGSAGLAMPPWCFGGLTPA